MGHDAPPPLPDRSGSDFGNPPPLPSSDSTPHVAPGEVIDDGGGRIFPCEQCGADLKFNIGQQSLACDYCGAAKSVTIDPEAEIVERDFEATLARLAEFRRSATAADDDSDINEVRCESCGGNIEFVGTLTSRECPYCGSPVQLEEAHKSDQDRVPVDGVLPFLVEQAKAKTNLAAWVSSRWFAPNEFKKRGVDGKFNGVYLSFFTFDSMTFTRYVGERGEHYYVTVKRGDEEVRERRTRWYDARGQFQRFFDDVLILANQGLPKKFLNKLRPWPLQHLVPFTQQLLAGHYARTYDIELPDCFGEAKQEIDQALYSDVVSRIGGDEQRVHNIDSQYDAITYKHVLLPVWLLAYRYGDKAYQVFVNASTGEVQGERPYSVWKIVFAVLTAIAVVGGIGLAMSAAN